MPARIEKTIELVRRLSKKDWAPDDEVFVQNIVKSGLPWEPILSEIENNSVAGLAHSHLKSAELLDFLPEFAKNRLRDSHLRIVQNNLSVISEMRKLSEILTTQTLDVLALQGLSLIHAYKDPGLRPLGDVDLMVEGRHRDRLKRVLADTGYRASATYPDMFLKNGLWVDIHTHPMNIERVGSRRHLFPEDVTSLWKQAVPLWERGGLLVPDPHDNFIALCAHALKHSYSRLVWLTDLSVSLTQLAALPDFPDTLLERVRSWRQEKPVLCSLFLLNQIFRTELSAVVMRAPDGWRLNKIEKFVLNHYIKGFASNELCFPLWLSMIRGNRAKIRFLKEHLFPSHTVMRQMYPQTRGINTHVRRTRDLMVMLRRNFRKLSEHCLSKPLF